MKKLIGYYRPCDILTLLSVISALIGILLVFNNHFTIAVIMLMICGLCDAFDGTLARKHKSTKKARIYGTELDSISDVIAFGVFPALLTITLNSNLLVIIISIFYTLCGVIRLAYFNMLSQVIRRKKPCFIGVPITTVSIVFPIIYFLLKIINFNLIKIIMPIVILLLGISFILKIKIPKPNVPYILGKIFNKYVLLFIIIPFSLILSLDLFYEISAGILTFNNFIKPFITHPIPYFIVYCIIISFISLLLGIFKKSKWVVIILFLIFAIFMVIADIKYYIMGLPVELSDVSYLNPDNIMMMGKATSTIGSWIWNIIIKTIIFILIGATFYIFTKYNEINIKSLKKRLIIVIAALILIIVEFILLGMLANPVLKYGYNLNKVKIYELETNDKLYSKYGYSSGMMLDYFIKKETQSSSYKKRDVLTELKKVGKWENNLNWGKANVVFILSESFFDITNVEELQFDKDIMPNIHKYAKDKNSYVFDLLVTPLGGISVNSEFEVLTGAPLALFNQGFVPYNHYYIKKNNKNAPNVIKEFNKNGYETMYITPWGPDSYHSKDVYSIFGADKTVYGNELNCEKKGMYCSDMILMDKIYNELKNTNKNDYKFIMTATGQNHFPYFSDRYKKYDIKATSDTFPLEETEKLRAYAQGVYDADKSLDYLYQKTKKLKVPTIIVFFGDHLPIINNNEKETVYFQSKYFNTKDENLNTLRKHTTKAVILANYNIKTESIKYLNSNYLGAYVLNNLNLEISDYFKYVDYVRENIPVFSRDYIYDIENAKIIKMQKVSKEDKTVIQNFRMVEQYSFYGSKENSKS